MQIDLFPGVWFSFCGGRLEIFRGTKGWNAVEACVLGEQGPQRQFHVQVFNLAKREPQGLIEVETRQIRAADCGSVAIVMMRWRIARTEALISLCWRIRRPPLLQEGTASSFLFGGAF